MNRRGTGRRRGFGRSRANRGKFGGPHWNTRSFNAMRPSFSPSKDIAQSDDMQKSESSSSAESQPTTTRYDPNRPHVEQSLCASCAVCMRVCPVGAISMDGPFASIDQQKCAGCGICVSACPRGAIQFGS